MSFLTNIVDFFSSSNKTHDQLNSFVNEKFTFFLNNSNLLLTFVSDFEDYKSGDPNIPIGKSKCNECEDLYILTSDIFEKYFNRINIPYDIDVSEGNSKTNYKDKVLYFFDLKDLKKILDEHNLEKSSSDITQLNKKRLLCKIISLSFIKLYIIVKSIYQTFNIYDSLIIEEKTEDYQAPVIEPLPPIDPTIDPVQEPALDPVQEPALDPVQELPLDPVQELPLDPVQELPLDPTIHPTIHPVQEPAGDPYGIPDPFHDPYKTPEPYEKPEPIQTHDPYGRAVLPIQTHDPYGRAIPPIQTYDLEPYRTALPLPPIEQNKNADTQSGGNVFYNMYNTLLGKKTESPIVTTNNVASGLSPASPSITGLSPASPSITGLSTETNPDLDPNLRKEKEKEKEKDKLQLSNNIFYSIFVILFEDSKDEQLDPTNFNVSFLTKGVSNMTNETLGAKIPEILQHISSSKIFELDFLGESCLIFRDDNFKFIQLETSDTESKEATMFIDEVDKQHEPFNKIIETKRKLLGTILNKENRDTIVSYHKSESQHKFANFKFFNAFKSHLKTMIKNYFDSRANLYNNIVKELFMFDKKTGAIISLNSNLTYKYISELSKKTEIILLDLHITLFKTLNSILTDSVNEINVMKKKAPLSAPVTTLVTAPVATQETAPVTAPVTTLVTTENEANIGGPQHLGGAKTIKHNKRNNKRSIKRNNKRSIKKNKKKRQTRKAKKQ